MLKKSKIILLDEATSALDNITEQKIQNSISNLMQNKTALIIAHRLSTIEDADVIYVLDKGRIIDSGNHEELLKNQQAEDIVENTTDEKEVSFLQEAISY